MRWLDMPRPVLEAYAENLANVQASEHLTHIGVSRIADAGKLKLSAAKRHQRNLERQTESRERRPANLDRIRAMGIRVERRGNV